MIRQYSGLNGMKFNLAECSFFSSLKWFWCQWGSVLSYYHLRESFCSFIFLGFHFFFWLGKGTRINIPSQICHILNFKKDASGKRKLNEIFNQNKSEWKIRWFTFDVSMSASFRQSILLSKQLPFAFFCRYIWRGKSIIKSTYMFESARLCGHIAKKTRWEKKFLKCVNQTVSRMKYFIIGLSEAVKQWAKLPFNEWWNAFKINWKCVHSLSRPNRIEQNCASFD